jgi:hypothetical protein
MFTEMKLSFACGGISRSEKKKKKNRDKTQMAGSQLNLPYNFLYGKWREVFKSAREQG